MVRKKRKVEDQTVVEDHAVADARLVLSVEGKPAVNVLGAGMIKKKPKPTTS